MTKLLLNIHEAEARYKVTGNRLRVLVSRGRLQPHYIDGRLYVEDQAVADLVRRKCPQCLEYFTPANNRQNYCGKRCRQAAFRAGKS